MAEWFASIGAELALAWAKFVKQFYSCFIVDDRWKWLWSGLGVTLKITLSAVILGIIIGCLVAMIRVTYDKTYAACRPGLWRFILKAMNSLAHIYLTIIRGTPVVVQLLIWYFVILVSSKGFIVACIAFGVNSGSYVAEIMRAGIMSVDGGQMEAGRSLGFTYSQTLRFIILPQAFKNVLPALCNEVIVLVKETAVCGYVGMQDLTKAGDIIRSRTFIAFLPLLAVAAIYLAIVMILTQVLGRLERRLRSSDLR